MQTPYGTVTDEDIRAIQAGLKRESKDLPMLTMYVQLALEREKVAKTGKEACKRAEGILIAAIKAGLDAFLGMQAGEDIAEEMVRGHFESTIPSIQNIPKHTLLEDLEDLDKPPAPTPIDYNDNDEDREDEGISFSMDHTPGVHPSPAKNEADEDQWNEVASQPGPVVRQLPFDRPRTSPSKRNFEIPQMDEVDRQAKAKEREVKNREEKKTDFAKLFANPFEHSEKPKFTPSPYQQAIFDWVVNGTGHALVNAVAGSGKTTTVVEAAKLMKGRCLFLAFNRHIKAELERRLPSNCEVMTLNSFGWKVCRENIRGAKMPGKYDRGKDDQILIDYLRMEPDDKFYNAVKKPIFRLIGLLKSLGEHDTSRYEEHASKYGVELSEVKDKAKFEKTLSYVYNTSVESLSLFSFDDQLFQPIYRNLPLPRYDWVIIDEMQDCSPIQIELASRLAESGRILGVGDPDQSIYLFRGAHPDAMNDVAERLDATWLPLSTCYRCPDAVIEAAKEEVPRIEAPVPNAKGTGKVERIETPEFLQEVRSGDMVLCRTTAPLVKRCLQKLRAGVKAYVKGRDVSEQLIDLIEEISGQRFDRKNIQSLRPDRRDNIERFVDDLQAYWEERSYKLEKAGRDIELMMLEDKVETVKALAEDKTYVLDIVKQIDRIFSDEEQEGIAFMTGHKSKGLESSRVFIIRPDLCPHPKAKQDAQKRQEKNLRYVMKTRAMSELYFVNKEKDEK